MWFAGNKNLFFFHIDRHRSAEVAKAILGENFNGTLVRDRYAAYNGIGVDWQVCIAHIITKAKEIRGEHVRSCLRPGKTPLSASSARVS